MTIYLDKLDYNNNKVMWQGQRLKLAKGCSKWKFMYNLITKSGKTVEELSKLKPSQIIDFIIRNKECALTKEDLYTLDKRPIVRLFKRCLKYYTTFDVYKAVKDGDNLTWWCTNASNDEVLKLVQSKEYNNKWTKGMKYKLRDCMTPLVLYTLLDAVKEENWTEPYGQESSEDREIFLYNNRIFSTVIASKVVVAHGCELFYPLYDKLLNIYLSRSAREARYLGDLKEIIGKIRSTDPRVFMSNVTNFDSYERIKPFFSGRWDSIRAMRWYDTDNLKYARRALRGWSTDELYEERVHELLYYGYQSYKGAGVHNSQNRRMSLWDLI